MVERREQPVSSSTPVCLWPACSVQRQPPLNYKEDRERLAHLEFEDAWGPVHLWEFRRVYVSPYGVLFRRGRVLPQSVDYSRSWDHNAPTFYKKIALGRVKRCPGRSVVVHNSFYKNYYHWTLEALPRLYLVRDHVAQARLLLCADVEPFHLQSLELFGPGGVEFIQRHELAFAEELLFPTPVNGRYGQHNPGLLKEMAAWILGRVARSLEQRGTAEGRLRLYIVRGGDKPRRLVNEPDVMSMVCRHGFRPVVLENLPVVEQIALFACSECVVGVHGAGLSNMLYMPAGSLIVELITEQYKNACYFNLASALGHRIIILPCKAVGNRNRHPKYFDLEADVRRLAAHLDHYGKTRYD